jgi:DnaK suppressor protein
MTLKKNEITKFKKRLEELRVQLTHSLKGTTAEVKTPDEATGYSQHQADQGTDDFDRTINLELTSKEYSILRQIDRALEKIEDNTYGICDVTGKEIPLPRLEAVPYAVMTVEAQEKREKGLI